MKSRQINILIAMNKKNLKMNGNPAGIVIFKEIFPDGEVEPLGLGELWTYQSKKEETSYWIFFKNKCYLAQPFEKDYVIVINSRNHKHNYVATISD